VVDYPGLPILHPIVKEMQQSSQGSSLGGSPNNSVNNSVNNQLSLNQQIKNQQFQISPDDNHDDQKKLQNQQKVLEQNEDNQNDKSLSSVFGNFEFPKKTAQAKNTSNIPNTSQKNTSNIPDKNIPDNQPRIDSLPTSTSTLFQNTAYGNVGKALGLDGKKEDNSNPNNAYPGFIVNPNNRYTIDPNTGYVIDPNYNYFQQPLVPNLNQPKPNNSGIFFAKNTNSGNFPKNTSDNDGKNGGNTNDANTSSTWAWTTYPRKANTKNGNKQLQEKEGKLNEESKDNNRGSNGSNESNGRNEAGFGIAVGLQGNLQASNEPGFGLQAINEPGSQKTSNDSLDFAQSPNFNFHTPKVEKQVDSQKSNPRTIL
jgi:hypothetical protein